MKALFQIKNTATGKVVEAAEFENKQQAKQKRRELNGKTKEGKEILVHVVTLGPDHDRYGEEKKSGTRHSLHPQDAEPEEAVA